MDEAERRAVLEQVASGAITPEEAASRLEEMGPGPDSAIEAEKPSGPAVAVGAVRQIKVTASAATATVVGDPTVAEALVEGPHDVRREGDQLVIEVEPLKTTGFTFGKGLQLSLPSGRPHRTLVRVNPEIDLIVNADLGSIRVSGVHSSIKAHASAGSVRIEDFDGPLDVIAELGSVRARGRLRSGESKIRCDAGSVRIALTSGTSARLQARTSMGRVRVDGEGARRQGNAIVVGDGAATLDIETNLGSVQIDVEK